jgi:hypothetical protein
MRTFPVAGANACAGTVSLRFKNHTDRFQMQAVIQQLISTDPSNKKAARLHGIGRLEIH